MNRTLRSLGALLTVAATAAGCGTMTVNPIVQYLDDTSTTTAIKARLGSRHIGSIAADDPVWETVAHALAQLCHAVVCAACPMRIAIGGGVMERQPHLLPRIQEMLVESIAGYLDLPTGAYVVAPELGGQAGPLGSIALAMDALTD